MSDFSGSNLLRPRDEPKPMEHHFFDYWRNRFNDFGWRDAADNVGRYLGATGAEKVYSEDQITQMPPITYRIGRNNTLIEGRTFTGRTDNEDFNKRLLSLQPGQKGVKFSDWWDAPYSPKRILPNAVLGIADLALGGNGSKLRRAYDDLTDTVAHPGTYASIGSFPLKSYIDFEAGRDGDKLTIKGTARHNLEDRFDFDPGQLADAPGRVLEKSGLAAEFPLRYESEQDVEAEGEYGPGGITIKRVTWGKRR